MASSRKSPRSSTLLARVSGTINQHVKSGERVVAGLSGGIDSVVLLDLLERASKKLRFRLSALHINHQINPAADRWALFCRAWCRKRGIGCKVVRVTLPRAPSVEAVARNARLREFAALRADFVALAHNLDDQSETVLLQLLRGAGVKGLSAMPEVRSQRSARSVQKSSPARDQAESSTHRPRRKEPPRILRPLLEISRGEIESYARSRKLEWIEDESNADTGYDRNFVRHRVLPIVAQRYPSYRTTLTRASHNFAEAAHLLDELAQLDIGWTRSGMSRASLRQLSLARAKNALRYFLAAHGVIMPNAARLDECVRQLQQGHGAAGMVVALGAFELRCYRDELCVVKKALPAPADLCRIWAGESSVHLPELGGTLVFEKCRGSGISLSRLAPHDVTVRLRRGGERMQPELKRPRRSLKNLLQEASIPPWQRDRLPLLFGGQTLVYVPGVGIDIAFHAAGGELGLRPRWEVNYTEAESALDAFMSEAQRDILAN